MNETECPNHPGVAVTRRCSKCKVNFCGTCVLASDRGAFCATCEPPYEPHASSYAPAAPASGGTSKVFMVVVVVCVVLFACVALTAIVAAISIPNLIQARKHGNEASAIGAMRTIGTSEAIFREGDKDQNGKLDYGSLSQLSSTSLIDSVLGSGTKQGYIFQVKPGKDAEKTFWAMAKPMLPGTTGDRVFYTNQDGAIYYIVVKDNSTAIPSPDPDTGEPPTAAARLNGR
jgi:hypothetical protein